ncbi:MAG: pentapeptide repeat-containing protein [Ignavibacteriales bacterium]
MKYPHENIVKQDNFQNLRADCENCFGLCCTALYFSTSEGFPIDKSAGNPCPNLQADFRCSIHENLKQQGLKGCLSFDCLGAGQKVSQISFNGCDWRKTPESAAQMFDAFIIMRKLHELLWYITEALALEQTRTIHNELKFMLNETEGITQLSHESLIKTNITEHWVDVNKILAKASELIRSEIQCEERTYLGHKKTFKSNANLIGADLRKYNLRGANFRGACLIAANLREADLTGTDFIGADLRDTDLRGANLTKSIFLTQAQINSAKGDLSTKLSPILNYPATWQEIIK